MVLTTKNLTQSLRTYYDTAVEMGELQNNIKENQETFYVLRGINSCLRPVNVYFVYPVAGSITNQIALPALKKLYEILGNGTVLAVGYFDNTRAEKIKDAWYDPISTQSLYKLMHRIRELSVKWGERKPVDVSILEYLDTCSIVAARRITGFCNDTIALLNMPEQLKSCLEQVRDAAKETLVRPMAKDGIEYGMSLIEEDKDGEPATEEQSQGAWSYWESFKSGLKKAAGYGVQLASAAGGAALEYKLNQVCDDTCKKIIEKTEKDLRQQIIARTAKSISRTAMIKSLRVIIRTGASMACYQLTENVLTTFMPHDSEESLEASKNMIRTASMCVTVAGFVLWLKCLSPTAQRMYRSYSEEFDPDASTLRDLASLAGQENIKSYVQTLGKNIPDSAKKSYFGNFTNRIANIKVQNPFEQPASHELTA